MPADFFYAGYWFMFFLASSRITLSVNQLRQNTVYITDVNVIGEDGATPLHMAVKHKQVDAASLLLANGAKLNAFDGRGKTCIHNAARKADCDMIKV